MAGFDIEAVEAAIDSGDKTAALEAYKVAQPEMHRGARVGVMHRNTAARKVSRLNARIKAL